MNYRNDIMNFKDWVILTEMFNSPLPIKWTKTTSTNWEGSFVIQDGLPNSENPANPIKNQRGMPSGKRYIIRMIKDSDMPWEVTFELVVGNKRSQDITGTGNAAQVFSTVLSGIRQWLDRVKPDAFALSAREPNRQSLYRRMLKMLPSKIWDVEDLGSTFFVQNKTIAAPVNYGYSDDDFDDYNDDI